MEVRPQTDASFAFPTFTPQELAVLPHDDIGPTVLGTSWSFIALALGFIGLRVYYKLDRRRGLWWDDYFLIASWVLLTVSTGLLTENIRLGYGKHIWDIDPENFLLRMPLIMNISSTFGIVATAWSKTSFALTLLRICDGWTWAAVWCIIASMNMLLGLSALFIWIQCTPIQKSWLPLTEGTCYPPERIVGYLMISAGYSALMDFILAFLPWKLLWRLNMQKKEKIGVIIAMSMGVFAGITAIIKVVLTPKIKDGDVYHGAVVIIWTSAEAAITMMAASVPILRTLLRQPAVRSAARHPPKSLSPKRAFTAESFSMQRQSTVLISCTRASSERTTSFWGMLRDEKEEEEGRGGGGAGGAEGSGAGGIWKVDEVVVEYEDRAGRKEES
ncbi:uncharacterized protein DNG_09529 [Cephalotrichum gorgonifer]|uniref:Rhodopsin domain-containing protein n=1 Tax=Cephalotrichum gorgonifer TaxID=2041049 RepID=A0AAE8N8I5_9PEZI|nr:uncharacterized protein DNG_09529 [Cephalotrichum gorgonifer]